MNKYAKYIILKSAIEDLFGSDAWYDLKESNHIPTWRKYALKTLKAIEFSIKDTVDIYDAEWINEIEESIERGTKALKSLKEIDEIIGVLAGVLINISFIQIGFMPRRTGNKRKQSFRKGSWRFNQYRTVVYLQTKEQKEQLFMDNQQRKIGFEEQMKLLREYHCSGSKVSYSRWCKT